MHHLARTASLTLVLALAGAAGLQGPAATAQAGDAAAPTTRKVRNDGTRPEPKANDERFDRMHRQFVERDKKGDVDLLFLGDSITAGWMTRAKSLFEQRYGPRAANFGIGGDHVYNVLWRLQNGEFETIKPKVVVLMIGTNDSSSLTGEQIARANELIIREIHARSPKTKVLLLGIFPRGPRTSKPLDGSPPKVDDGVTRMAVIRDANARLARLDDGRSVRFLDIGERFLKDSRIPDEIMPDQLHPSAAGYQIWADAMQPLLDEMLRD